PEFRVLPEQRGFGAEVEATQLVVSRHVNLRAMNEALRPLGGAIHNTTPYLTHFILVELAMPADRFMDLGRMTGVYTVQKAQPVMPRGEMSNQAIVNPNFTSNQNVQPGYAAWLAETGYDGTGVIVSIIDDGIRTTHLDMVGQMVACISGGTPTSCTTNNTAGHGTHVAGAVAGSGNSGITDSGGFLRGQGVAPGARLVQQRYNSGGLSFGFGTTCTNPQGPFCLTPSGMLTLFREAHLSGALLANNSWGSGGIKIGYDLPSQQVDVMTRDARPDLPGSQPVLPVWSIQNGRGTVAGACGGNSLGSPDEAKNLFGVGSTQLIPGNFGGGSVPNPSNFFNVSWNSAHGPACDGRIGLEIVAPGCATDSPVGSGDTNFSAGFCGTSMASPVVTGALAVWIERYRDLFDADPSPAMMRAAMTAVAVNMHGNLGANGQTITETPSRFQGFGRVNLDAAVNPPFNVMYFDQETVFTQTGQSWDINLVAEDPTEPVRLMLTWTDAPGSGLGGATPAWVNLLDLVVDADSGRFLGNQLGPDGFSQTGGVPDDRNNIEAVFLRPDQHNGQTFEVSVNAANIVADALNPHTPGTPQQDFALVCYNCQVGVDTFVLSLSADAVEMCLPDDGEETRLIAVDLAAQAGYEGTVTLSASGEPAGVSSSLDPVSVAVPGSSDWTLTISDSASAGSFVLELIGDDGEETKSRPLSLRLDALLNEAPELLAPADGSTDQSLSLSFEWQPQLGAIAYRLQLATDADFEDVLIDEQIEDTSFDAAIELALSTEYFWRVAGDNLCGQGAWSEVFSFTTRDEPQAEVSATRFSLELAQNDQATLELAIANIGTGSLEWSISTDQQAARQAGGRFAGDFAPEAWTLVNTPGTVDGSVAMFAGPPIEMVLTGGANSIAGTTDWQIRIPASGTLHFSWGYESTDTGDFDGGGYVINGQYTELANNAAPVPFFNQSRTVEVEANDLFAFRVRTEDGLFGPGILGVTNFEFRLDVCGEDQSRVDWLRVTPASGSVLAGESQTAVITVTSINVPEGEYTGFLCLVTNADNAVLLPIEVNLRVTDEVLPVPPMIFRDRLEAP
ncbi:MAG: S8 family serine peptidase, partial [Wenzhouxiangella sp.]